MASRAMTGPTCPAPSTASLLSFCMASKTDFTPLIFRPLVRQRSVIPGRVPVGSHLDPGGPRQRMSGREPDGRVPVGALDDDVAADLLFRLGKGPVGDQYLAVT